MATAARHLVVGPSGKRFRQDMVTTNGQLLLENLRQLRSGAPVYRGDRVVLVALGAAEFHVDRMVVVRGDRRQRAPKTDVLDAHSLAERLRTNRLGHPVFKSPAAVRHAARAGTRPLGCDSGPYAGQESPPECLSAPQLCIAMARLCTAPTVAPQSLRSLFAALREAVSVLGEQVDHLSVLKAQVEATMVAESSSYELHPRDDTRVGSGARGSDAADRGHTASVSHEAFLSYCGFAIVTHLVRLGASVRAGSAHSSRRHVA